MADEDMAEELRELELSLKSINSNPFPSFKYVSQMIKHNDLRFWSEYSENP